MKTPQFVPPPVVNPFMHPSEQKPVAEAEKQSEEADTSKMNVDSLLDCTSYGGVNLDNGKVKQAR